MRIKHFRFYSPDDTGGSVPPEVGQAAGQVEQAAEEMKTAAEKTTNDSSAATYQLIHDVLAGIHTELKRSNDRAEQATQAVASTVEEAAEAPAAVAEEAQAEVEAPPDRSIRRGRRKVKR